MTFSCAHHDYATDTCLKLKSSCVMGRPGCVLEGRVTLSEVAAARLHELEQSLAAKRKRRKKTPKAG